MPKRTAKGVKTASEDTSGDLSIDNDEIFRLINKTDVLNGVGTQFPSDSSKAYKIVRPSELDALNAQQESSSNVKPAKKLVELIDGEETESIRVEESNEELVEEDDEPPIGEFGEEMFRLAMCMIVFGTLWLCLDILIHSQYAQETSIRDELGRAVNVLPGLAFVIYFTGHYPSHLLTKLALLAMSIGGGSHMIWAVNHAGYLQVMRRCPVLGTLWIWSVVQLDLIYAVASLAAVTAYVKWQGLLIVTR